MPGERGEEIIVHGTVIPGESCDDRIVQRTLVPEKRQGKKGLHVVPLKYSDCAQSLLGKRNPIFPAIPRMPAIHEFFTLSHRN